MTRRTPRVLRPWQHWFQPHEVALDRIPVRSRDNLDLVIHRLRPAERGGPAVMLLHGLGSNRHVFHFPGRSMATWLAAQGYDCYLPELRGHGESERPRFDWMIDEYLKLDLPAVIDRVREVSGSDQIHWVGHSMGGLLLFCFGILNPDAPIASGLSIGSGLDYRVGYTSFRELLHLKLVLERIPMVPWGTFAHAVAPLSGRPVLAALDRFNANPQNCEPAVLRHINALCFHTVPMSLLSSLSWLFSRRGLRTRDRATYFLEKAQSFKIPLCLVGGTRDLQISVAAVRQTASLVGGPAEVRIYGREHGEKEDYGHWDLVVGRHAEHEVWPDIGRWLARHANVDGVQQPVSA